MTALRKTARVVERAWRQDNGPKSYPHYCAVRQSDKCTPVAVVSLTPESIEALVEKAAEEIAFAIAAAYARGTLDAMVVNEKREDYECARKVVTAILGKTGRGK